MQVSGLRQRKKGAFNLEVWVQGGAKTIARRMAVGLGTRDPIEADARARVVKAALSKAELIQGGMILPPGRPKKQP